MGSGIGGVQSEETRRRSALRHHTEHPCHGIPWRAAWHAPDPKTKARRREVPLAPPAREALLDWKAAAGVLGPDTYVWPGVDGGPFARTSVMKRARGAWTRAKLQEIGLHEARHSAASMWIASGWPVKVVSELIGHASVAITLDRYGAPVPGGAG